MAESAESLYRRGMISPRQAGKLGILKATKAQPSKMADFDAKESGGSGDGSIAGRNHINNRGTADLGSPQRASGKPSTGAFVKNKGGQPRANEIDEPAAQKPNFPRQGSRASKQSLSTPKRARGRVTASGPEYGGPNSRSYG